MKKVISPGSKRKNNISNKTFGVTLDELMKRETSSAVTVPSVVSKICDFILSNAVEQEGIFRISGSMRVMDKIRTSFDKSGDANLLEDHDMMAVASSLKLFLRELPVSLIPETMNSHFIELEEAYGESRSEFIAELLPLLKQLPQLHYDLLKYLIYFLVKVSCFESSNKMHANALAIVFGPNIFRCGAGISGLHDQAITNKVIHKLIVHFDDIFIPAASPQSSPTIIKVEQTKTPRTPPPRPPPPKLGTSSPLSSPRPKFAIIAKNETTNVPNGDVVNGHIPNKTGLAVMPMSSMKMISPRLSDEDSGRASPFILDSETGHSLLESPVVPSAASELVEKTINKTIKEHVFGDVDASATTSSVDDATHDQLDSDTLVESVESCIATPRYKTHSPPNTAPKLSTPQRPAPPHRYIQPVIPAARSRCESERSAISADRDDPKQQQSSVVKQEASIAVNDLIRQFQEKSQSRSPSEFSALKSQKPRPNSTAFTGGRNIPWQQSPINEKTALSVNHQQTTVKQETTSTNEQTMSRKQTTVKQKMASAEQTTVSQRQTNEKREFSLDNIVSSNAVNGKEFIHGNFHSPRSSGKGASESKSTVPRLDFSSLHQQVKCEEARVAEKGFAPLPGQASMDDTALYINVNASNKQDNKSQEDEAPLSPRAYESPYDASVPPNTDMPPSPPTNQDPYITHSIDATSLKQANKRIHSVKRKIKAYEDNFQKEHGYKPSLREKTSDPEVKKYIAELNKCKKEVKRLKEDASVHNRNNSRVLPDDNDTNGSSESSTLQTTLDDLLTRLQSKRVDVGRPEDLTLMSPEQVQDEKLAVQKALLQFESIHGRPSSREEKDVMRPLYDRYRTIKRILTKSAPVNVDPDLQTVPEDYAIDLDHHDQPHPTSKWANTVKIPTGSNDDFTVTRDMGLLRETNRPIIIENLTPDPLTPDDSDYLNSHLHHMSTQELRDELDYMNKEKKELRKVLRQYEDDFYRENGRKVQKEDRIPLSGEYIEYKRVKSRLKLLEVLVSKQ